MIKIKSFLKLLIVAVILWCLTLCNVSANNLNMPLNNVFSGDLYNYDLMENWRELGGEVFDVDYGIAYIKPDNTLWISGVTTGIDNYVKIADNVNSVKMRFLGKEIAWLKDDGTVWLANLHNIESSKKIFDNVSMIDAAEQGTIYLLRNDNSLWVYGKNNIYGDGIYRIITSNEKPIKIMDDISYIKVTTPNTEPYFTSMSSTTNEGLIIIKTNGSLWQNDIHTIDTPKMIMTQVVDADIHNNTSADIGNMSLGVRPDGSLYYWYSKKLNTKRNIIKLADSIKYAKFNGEIEINMLKTDNSLWSYIPKWDYVSSEEFLKVSDNINSIIGDKEIYAIDKSRNIFSFPRLPIIEENHIIGTRIETSEQDYDVKFPDYNKKEIINLTAKELKEYQNITATVLKMKNELTKELKKCTDNMIEIGYFEIKEKEIIDIKIKEYENYLKEYENKIIINVSDAGENGLKIYTNETEKDIFYNDKYMLDELKENIYNIEDNNYENVRRYYAINVLCYSNDWRNLSLYSINLFKNNENNSMKKFNNYSCNLFYTIIEFLNYTENNLKSITKNIDDIEITKTNNIYNINLSNIKSYEILNPSEETYGYYLFKIIANNGNTYIITGFDNDVDYYKGYMYPTGNGTAIEQGSIGNHIFVMDTSEIENSINGEMYSINDILYMYIKQNKADWNYKDINITRGKNNEYIIKIKDAELIDGKGSSYVNRWLYHDAGDFLKQLTTSCFKINGKNTKYMYSMNDSSVNGFKRVNIYTPDYLDESNLRDLDDYNGAIDYYVEDGKVYIKHKDKEIIIMSE